MGLRPPGPEKGAQKGRVSLAVALSGGIITRTCRDTISPPNCDPQPDGVQCISVSSSEARALPGLSVPAWYNTRFFRGITFYFCCP